MGDIELGVDFPFVENVPARTLKMVCCAEPGWTAINEQSKATKDPIEFEPLFPLMASEVVLLLPAFVPCHLPE